jgi:hypothetical protein
MDNAIASATANVSAAIAAIDLVRTGVVSTSTILQGDLTSLGNATDTLRTDYEASRVALADASHSVYDECNAVDAAARAALEGLVIFITLTFKSL